MTSDASHARVRVGPPRRAACPTRAVRLACVLAIGLVGCAEGPGGPPPPPADPAASPSVGRYHGLSRRMSMIGMADSISTLSKDPSPFRFVDIREGSGIDFVHVSGSTDEKHFPTQNGSGVALFDHDGDGRLDIYFASFNPMPPGTSPTGKNRLYKNLGGGRFRDVTEASGLGFSGYCHGIIAGDIDNDGDPDVFLCNYGANALYLNDGKGAFRDVSRGAGIDAPGWSTGGAMLDYDSDGDLDIYVANYGEWAYPQDAHPCSARGVPLFCGPETIRTVRHTLYRNNGNGTFEDATDEAGLGRSDGHGFGAVAADLNGDGRVDLYVANDTNPNFLYLNKGDGTFEDATEVSGAAFDEKGKAQSSMGLDVEDVDGDGLPDLLVTNYQAEYDTYYRNLGSPGGEPARRGAIPPASFRDETSTIGLAVDTMPWIGWGCALADFDSDGWPDCFIANGHLDANREKLGPTLRYAEPPTLHRNVPAEAGGSGRRLRLSTRDAGAYFASKHVGRGAAFGDIDDDGDVDIVVNHMDAPPAVLRNDTPGGNRWIRLRLVGTRSNRDAIGTRVEVEAGGRTIVRQRKGGCSMQSTNDPRLLIGLGAVEAIDRVTVRWPSGAVSILNDPVPGETHQVVEPRNGNGDAASIPAPTAASDSNAEAESNHRHGGRSPS